MVAFVKVMRRETARAELNITRDRDRLGVVRMRLRVITRVTG